RVLRDTDKDAGQCLPMMVPEGRGRSLGNLQHLGDLSKLAQRQQRRPKREAQVDRSFRVFSRLRQVLESAQGLLIGGARLTVTRPPGRPPAGLSRILHRRLPQRAMERVMGESLDLLTEAVSVERLDGVGDPRVKLAPASPQEPAVRDLVREGM